MPVCWSVHDIPFRTLDILSEKVYTYLHLAWIIWVHRRTGYRSLKFAKPKFQTQHYIHICRLPCAYHRFDTQTIPYIENLCKILILRLISTVVIAFISSRHVFWSRFIINIHTDKNVNSSNLSQGHIFISLPIPQFYNIYSYLKSIALLSSNNLRSTLYWS